MVFVVDRDKFDDFYEFCQVKTDTQFTQNCLEVGLFDVSAVISIE